MSEDVKQFVAKCATCQFRKTERALPTGDINHFEITEPFAVIAIDCMGPITESLRGNKHLLVATDCLTRFVEARPIPDVSAQSFVDFLCDYCGSFGAPKAILTDNASTFSNKYCKELMEVFGIKHCLHQLTAAAMRLSSGQFKQFRKN